MECGRLNCKHRKQDGNSDKEYYCCCAELCPKAIYRDTVILEWKKQLKEI